MDLDANELESICYSYDRYSLLFLYSVVVVGVAENDFQTVVEELESYVAMPFELLLLISDPIAPEKRVRSSEL